MTKALYGPLLLLQIVAVTLLTGCPTNPIRTAETVEQRGDALYGQYVILKEQGAAILQDAAVPDAVKRPIAKAMVDTKPVADMLQDSLIEFSKAKADLAAGTTTEERLLIASEKLNGWITQIGPLIRTLRSAVEGA